MKHWKLICGCVVLTILLCGIGPLAAASEDTDQDYPEVLSPEDGSKVPRTGEDPSCPAAGPCTKVYVKGRVPEGFPFLAVAPLNAAPRIWIQPPISSVRRDRTFEGMVYLGTDKVGAGEKYQIFVFACKEGRFKEGEVLMGLPKDCEVSDPATVLRTK